MQGSFLLAFAVILVVVLFVYMSMKLAQEKKTDRSYAEIYHIELVKGFSGDSLSVYVNDSLLLSRSLTENPVSIDLNRFADQSALMIVDHNTEKMNTFNLSENGGNYKLEKVNGKIRFQGDESE